MLGNKDIVAFLPTRDFDTSRAFYEGVLGLRFVHNDGFAMVLDANGTMVRVSKVGPDFKPAVFTILGWEVSGIETVVAALAGKGVVFERFSFFESRTSWASGPLRPATRLPGSRTRTETPFRCHSTSRLPARNKRRTEPERHGQTGDRARRGTVIAMPRKKTHAPTMAGPRWNMLVYPIKG